MRSHVKTVRIVSLSRGLLGEDFISHELKIGENRLQDLGLTVQYSDHAKSGIEYLETHPELRAKDLLDAFTDDSVDMILCSIGGDDTYRLLPYLFENHELEMAVNEMKSRGKEKIFLGFSDTTMNHFMLHKAGLSTFYGQAFLPDICEISDQMLPYTEQYFRELISNGTIRKVTPSAVWYEARTDFGEDQVGTELKSQEDRGFVLLQGNPRFQGEILGGCIDTIYDMFDNERYENSVLMCERYGIFPSKEKWRNKILLLETSEEIMSPKKYEKALNYLKQTGLFEEIRGILLGKPVDRIYEKEYWKIVRKVVADETVPIAANLNIGHAQPRCILPLGVHAEVDTEKQCIKFDEKCHDLTEVKL